MTQDEFGKKALELACHYQNRFCEQEEIIEMFCLDAQAAQKRKPLTDAEITSLYFESLGQQRIQDAALLSRIVRAVEQHHGITAQQGGANG